MTTHTSAEAIDATRVLVAMARARNAGDLEAFDALARGIEDPDMAISAAVSLLALTARGFGPLVGQTADAVFDAMAGLSRTEQPE